LLYFVTSSHETGSFAAKSQETGGFPVSGQMVLLTMLSVAAVVLM